MFILARTKFLTLSLVLPSIITPVKHIAALNQLNVNTAHAITFIYVLTPF